MTMVLFTLLRPKGRIAERSCVSAVPVVKQFNVTQYKKTDKTVRAYVLRSAVKIGRFQSLKVIESDMDRSQKLTSKYSYVITVSNT